MAENFEITRREFIRNSALLSAGTALGHAAILPQDSGPHAYVPGPVFPYGAVYFRKTNPPEEDWARDHETAARVGMNIFRHWFMWSAIEVAPGKYDWSDYDRMMDLAAKNGIKRISGEIRASRLRATKSR
jgi:beta-galactosidase